MAMNLLIPSNMMEAAAAKEIQEQDHHSDNDKDDDDDNDLQDTIGDNIVSTKEWFAPLILTKKAYLPTIVHWTMAQDRKPPNRHYLTICHLRDTARAHN